MCPGVSRGKDVSSSPGGNRFQPSGRLEDGHKKMNASLEITTRSSRLIPRAHALRILTYALSGVLAASIGGTRVRGASLIPKDKPAPDFTLRTLDGQTVRLSGLKGRVVLLLFGELYNRNSINACKDVAAVLARPAMTDIKTSAYLLITQKTPAADLLAEAKKKGVALPILHDDGRRTFATYRVMVLPSLMVIDPEGATVLPCAGYPLDFQDMVADAILFATGRLSGKEFDRRRTTTTMPAAPESHVRAVRLAALGQQLAKRGSEELAISNFRHAIALDPDCISARVGLGTCLLNRRNLAEAEKQFLHVLGINSESVEASVGLIHIQVIRGGGELTSAKDRLGELLRKRPNDPKVVYLAGIVAEKTGDAGSALGYYKRAAELLLYGRQQRWELK